MRPIPISPKRPAKQSQDGTGTVDSTVSLTVRPELTTSYRYGTLEVTDVLLHASNCSASHSRGKRYYLNRHSSNSFHNPLTVSSQVQVVWRHQYRRAIRNPKRIVTHSQERTSSVGWESDGKVSAYETVLQLPGDEAHTS